MENGKNADRKGNSSLLWFSMVVILTLMITSLVVFSQTQRTLQYDDFVRLVKATKYSERGSKEQQDPQAGAIVLRERSTTPREIQLSAPNNIRVDDRLITGEVRYRVLSGPGASDKESTIGFKVNKLKSEAIDNELRQLLADSNANWEFSSGPTGWEKYGFILISTGAILLLFLFMMRRLGGAGGPMQFGRSRGRLYAEEDLGVTFDDAAGIDEAVEEVREVVDFLKSPEKYQKLGGRIPRGVLLVGPPGTGKTLLAKAIAGEAGVPFFSLSGSDFVEMFVGVGAARVRDMFQQAVAKAPCIIFIDELDALGKTRGNGMIGGHDEREQTLNALLVEMDGFDSNSGVIVIGATNRPETLDQALMRPGRFDRHVLVDRPDIQGREDILKVHVKNVKLDPSVDLKKIAAISPGFGGADLANLVNEAALLAARKEKSSVGMIEFNEAVERVTAGLEKKNRVMTPEEKQRVAYHEAGHALVAFSLPNTDPVHKVSIIPRGIAALGYTMQRPDNDRYLMTQSELESQLQILLAGTIAEELIYEDISSGAQNDLERVTDISRAMVMQFGMSQLGKLNFKETRTSPFLSGAVSEDFGRMYSEKTAQEIDDEVRRIVADAVERVRRILNARKPSLIALTNRLIEIESVDSTELKRIIDESSPGPWVVPGTENATPRRGMSAVLPPLKAVADDAAAN
jgi:cell division protease FtsH